MHKIYALAPLVGLLLFGSYYWKHARLHEARMTEIARLEDIAKQARRAEQGAARTKAEEQARITIAQRKQEREEKDRLEEAQKQARLGLEQRRNAAMEQARKLRPQIDRLRSDLQTIDAAIARSEERKRELQQEQTFLTGYVKEAEANRNTFYGLLQKLETVERSRPTGPSNPRPVGLEKG